MQNIEIELALMAYIIYNESTKRPVRTKGWRKVAYRIEKAIPSLYLLYFTVRLVIAPIL